MCNSSSISEEDLLILGSLRGGAATLCALLNLVLLTVLLLHSDHTSPLHRLLSYLSLSSLLLLVANALQTVSVGGCSAHWHTPVCEFVGFANQFASCMLLMVSLWVILLLAVQYWCPNNRVILTPKLDLLAWGAVVTASLLSAAVPLGTDGYGVDLAWCWIKGSRRVEQVGLWYGWVVGSMTLALALLTGALCYSERRTTLYYEYSRGINSCQKKVSKETARRTKALLCWMALYTVVVSAVIVARQVPHVQKERTFLVVLGVLEPISVLAVPVIFITHLYDHRQRLKVAERPQGLAQPPCPAQSRSEAPRRARYQQREDLSRPLNSQETMAWVEGSEDTGEEVTSSLLLTQTLRSDYSDST